MTLLLLAGTGEAKIIAQNLADENVPAIASLAGATRAPAPLAIWTRTGGFGGADAFSTFLDAQQITAVFDATHPFAHRISHRTAKICAARALTYCQFLRPAWTAGHQDSCLCLDQGEDAAQHITPGSNVFLATGRQTLDRFANLSHCTLICRQIDPPDGPFPFPNGRFEIGRPPFSEEDEYGLFQKLKIDWLIAKNAGGAIPRTKLDAARRLGIRVALLNRPPQPDAPKVETVTAALDWIRAL